MLFDFLEFGWAIRCTYGAINNPDAAKRAEFAKSAIELFSDLAKNSRDTEDRNCHCSS